MAQAHAPGDAPESVAAESDPPDDGRAETVPSQEGTPRRFHPEEAWPPWQEARNAKWESNFNTALQLCHPALVKIRTDDWKDGPAPWMGRAICPGDMMVTREYHRPGQDCVHMHGLPPDHDPTDMVIIPPGTIFGPVRCVQMILQGSQMAVEVPMGPQYGLRWVVIWSNDRNQPSYGTKLALPLKHNVPKTLIHELINHFVVPMQDIMDISLLDHLEDERSERSASAPPPSLPAVPQSSLGTPRGSSSLPTTPRRGSPPTFHPRRTSD